ncbi:unnamed protein product [Lymnaea stagnalis]|uniref:Enhancer of polycomb-like protein n=1 Tax=Lymnaea stagnalis TaxID=6523 RepID=A0AAV2IIW4_LYMST
MDQEIPDYDMDSDDDSWLNEQSKKMEITPIKFEEMMDRLEKGSGQQVVTLQEAKLLLKEDDDLIIAVYDYWLNKRLKMQRPLIATVKSEKRDGTTTNNPYVAFRRRTEKMQTRKNRKNDEVSYEKMLKLRRDLQKTLTLLELLKRREKSKKELLQLTIEILEKRNEMEDFSGTALAEAEEEREKHPTFVPPFALNSRGEWVQTYKGEETAPIRKKRQYRKRKQAQQQQQNQIVPHTAVHFQHQQHSSGDIDIMDSSDDDMLSPAMSQSDHEDENDPDGMFAFKRRKHCHYHQPIHSGLGNWPWHGPEEGGRGDKRFRFSLTSLPTGCMAYARRRIGRGGRVIFDRASTTWDETLERLDLNSSHYSSIYSDYITYVRDNHIPHYRPKTPPPEETRHSPSSGSSNGHGGGGHNGGSFFSHSLSDFDVESFQSHREQLLEMQREQQQKLFTEDDRDTSITLDLEHTLTQSELGSRFTLDSASAEFAVRALVDSPNLVALSVLEGTTPSSVSTAAASPVGSRTNSQQFSFSLINKSGDAAGTSGTNGKTLANSISSGKISHSDSAMIAKLPIIASSVLPASVSLLHKSSSAPVLPQVTLPSNAATSSALPSSVSLLSSASSTTILLPHKTNGPLSSTHVKSSGLSTSPAASVLQLNFPASSASLITTIPSLVSTPAVITVAPSSIAAPVTTSSTGNASLQLQRPLNNKVAASTTAGTLYKLPVSATQTSNFDILRSNHEEILFNKDTGIPMDVT